MTDMPEIDIASPLQFVINAAARSSDAEAKREVIEAALRAGGRRGDLLFCSPAESTGVAHQAATRAIATRAAVVAVGGGGTLNTVAQAAHAVGCVMGLVPQGTFNYSARTHGIPADPAGADLVMGGHIHLPCVIALQDMARQIWAVQAGTAVSSRVRKDAPSAVNLLCWGEDSAPVAAGSSNGTSRLTLGRSFAPV